MAHCHIIDNIDVLLKINIVIYMGENVLTSISIYFNFIHIQRENEILLSNTSAHDLSATV